MATLPKATTNVVDTAGAVAAGTDTVCVIAPVPANADATPRLYGDASSIYSVHGYSEGVEYAALHAQGPHKPILFVGVPIAAPGTISRENTSGRLTGTSVTTLAAGSAGILSEHDGVISVISGGVVGTDQIVLGLSLDGGVTVKRVRLGTANQYVVPFVGVTVSFGAGTLVAGEVVHTWHGSGPKSDATGWAAAFAALGKGAKNFRSSLLIGDLATDTEAAAYLSLLNAYRTVYERFVGGRCSVFDRLPLASMSRVSVRLTGTPSITFVESVAHTITRSTGSWIADGFVVNDTITVTGTSSNNLTGKVTAVSALVLTCGAVDFVAEGPITGCSVVGSPTLTFAEVGATGDTITRSRGSWLTDGFRVGDAITVTGTVSNNVSGAAVAAVTSSVITMGTTDLTPEVISSSSVSVGAGQTKAQWMAAADTEFAPIDDAPRISLGAGRARVLSPFTGWWFRRPVSWADSLRAFSALDVHVATWRKSDGPTGWDLFDESGALAEYDDRVDGAAGSAARFSTFRTYSNGPQGAFITQSLTRAVEGSVLTHTHNQAVVDVACTIVQLQTEEFIGRGLQLNDDGTATSDALAVLEGEVNSALARGLYANRGEGPRVSKAVWVASKTDVLNVAEPLLTGVLSLNLNGTIHSVTTNVRVISGGQ